MALALAGLLPDHPITPAESSLIYDFMVQTGKAPMFKGVNQ